MHKKTNNTERIAPALHREDPAGKLTALSFPVQRNLHLNTPFSAKARQLKSSGQALAPWQRGCYADGVLASSGQRKGLWCVSSITEGDSNAAYTDRPDTFPDSLVQCCSSDLYPACCGPVRPCPSVSCPRRSPGRQCARRIPHGRSRYK